MHTPVVIGVGDVRNISRDVDNAKDPAALMLEAIHIALQDTTLPSSPLTKLQSSIDSIDVVRTWTWPYTNLPGLLATNLGVQPVHTFYSENGGNQPAKLFDEAARRVAQGQCKVAVVTGGEALASLTDCVKAGKNPPPGWPKPPEAVNGVFSPTTRRLGNDVGSTHFIGSPVQIYPLYEAGFRAARRQTLQENHDESATLYGEFAAIAAANSFAWSYGRAAHHADSIVKITPKNRMINLPYPLLMNAFNTVNMAAACVLTSTTFAQQLGIPESKWIYPLGGAGTEDSPEFWKRVDFCSSPAMSASIDTALQQSRLLKNEIDFYDFYSCFPIVPKLACSHLGLPITGQGDKPISLLGGLTSFGGAGNNYSLHAITAAVRKLRDGKTRNGLIVANGGVLTYYYVVCLSKQQPQHAYPECNPLPDRMLSTPPRLEMEPEGESFIETYTVEFGRDGKPQRGYIVGRLKSNGARFVANHADATTLHQLASANEEQIGRDGWVSKGLERDRNLFSFSTSRL